MYVFGPNIPLPGVRCQGPLCCLSLRCQGTPSWLCVRCPWWFPQPGVRCLGPLCWLVRAPCPGWRPAAHLWPLFAVAWCSSFSSRADFQALHDLPCKLHLCSPSPAPSVPAPTASVPVSAPVGPVSAASDAAASDVPVTAGRVASSSAPMSAPLPRGKVTADDDGEVPYDPMLHPDVSDAMEDSLDIPKGCTLFSDIDGMV
ncbi:hypothetical protein V6N13_051294 [Hibiscus sabdariffa]